ncbi:hypothetical protein PFICI_11306 [Pestalotiopsis fici W106-1]|uniref:Uncharacterized protein n=1 Tax=Pestalotiopsis fici (strain W106-1 / CGMCC3.15140) TaxID=1229662 RepID=W3WWD4_PESFW|nr:uncharacterized protein PFICI_11306 [Pestalotiopsis fici W106-1]ETS77432.1 hypothetical protein PFICI_11306 [Pestalotiopsis fici W106-1]
MAIFTVSALALAGYSLAVYVFYTLYQVLASPLRSVPGPFLARFTNLWYLYHLYRGDFQVVNQNLHKKYGAIVRYGPNRYSFNSLDAGKAIYWHGTSFEKSAWYEAWKNPKQWTLFADRNIRRHAANRRMYQNTYSMSSLINYEPHVDECADLFCTRLNELAETGLTMNMGHWLQCYAFDVIGAITYSKRLGFLDHGLDVGNAISALEGFLGYATLTGVYASIHPYLFAIRNYLAGSKGTGRAYIQAFTKECMDKHQANAKVLSKDGKSSSGDAASEEGIDAATDFLTKFALSHTKNPDSFTVYHIAAGCDQNMAAGSDTTAISLSAIVYYLLKNPACLQKLREEINELRTAGTISSNKITFKESQDMPYLQAVMKEALRMHPALGLPLERVVPEGGAVIGGRLFPENSIVGINTWVEHRNPIVFGTDADEFRPERWFTDDAAKLASMNSHWVPFGLGSRTCIGRHISMLEMSKLIPRLVRDYDFELAQELSGTSSTWSTRNYWFVKPTNFSVKVTMREK